MKRTILLCLAVCMTLLGSAQTDSTKKDESDTIRIGGMIIIRKKGGPTEIGDSSRTYRIPRRNREKPANIATNWWIFDIGFSNYTDNTNYGSAAAQTVAPGLNEDNFKLSAGKSRSVNVWFFMQRLNVIKHVVNLKYGMGLELNNYHFDDTRMRMTKNPTLFALSTSEAKKAKLAADYLTVPMMVNFNFTPKRKKGFGISAGVSAGYLYSARFKIKDDGDKDKVNNDFDLKRWKLSYIGELSLGPIKLYGSYAMDNMWDKGLDMTPYNVGFRLSHF
ncbi:MAG: outer membrane beta-barrel protein [Chitinophagales bacterium]|nr:outer membrane beta-barrel protein [Chitinophagales bacterium]